MDVLEVFQITLKQSGVGLICFNQIHSGDVIEYSNSVLEHGIGLYGQYTLAKTILCII